jgi:DNA-binding transcriptional ArsR family regulator
LTDSCSVSGENHFSKALLLYIVLLILAVVVALRLIKVTGIKHFNWDDETMSEHEPNGLMTRDEDIDRASRSLKAMSHPLRLKILCVLGDQEVSVQDIVERVGTSQSNISQHLAILRDKGILSSRKDANRVYYKVVDARTLQLIIMMRNVFCTA